MALNSLHHNKNALMNNNSQNNTITQKDKPRRLGGVYLYNEQYRRHIDLDNNNGND